MPSTLTRCQLEEKVKDHTVSLVRIHASQLADLTQDDAATDYNRSRFAYYCMPGESSRESQLKTSWYGGIGSFENARKLYTEGWRAGAERAERLFATIEDMVPASVAPRRVRRSMDEGDDLRVEKVLDGDFDNAWWSTRRELLAAPNVVSFAFGWLAPNYIEHEHLIWNALQAIALADALENNGYRVELRAIDGTTPGSNAHVTELMVKSADEPLQPDLIAATIGHAGVYRTLGFGAHCMHLTNTNYGLGACLNGKIGVTPYLNKLIEAGHADPVSYWLPRADSQEQAIANIKNALKELNAVTL